MTEPIELRHLEQYVFGDQALLDEILSIFVDQVTLLVERLHGTEDDAEWRSAAHTLKGASRGVGAWALGDLAKAAENLAGPCHSNVRQEMLQEISRSASEAVAHARQVRDRRDLKK